MVSNFQNTFLKIFTLILLLICSNCEVVFLSPENNVPKDTNLNETLSQDIPITNHSETYKDLMDHISQHFKKGTAVHFDFWTSICQSILSILFSEIADKTFILILYFSSKCNRNFVFFSATTSLLFMNLFTIAIGYSFRIMLYKRFIDWLVLVSLFFIGVSIIRESLELSHKSIEDNYISQLRKKEKKKFNKLDKESIPVVFRSAQTISHKELRNDQDLVQPLMEMETAVQNQDITRFKLFWMIFSTLAAAECGDRSQIATLLISAEFEIFGVIIGTCLALLACNILNVFLGNQLAKYIREKHISFICGLLFILYSFEIILKKFSFI